MTEFEGFHHVPDEDDPQPGAGKTNGKAAEPPKPYRAWRIADMKKLKPPEFVAKGIIPAKAQSTFFGLSGHYKTMTAIDLIVAIAYERDWHGHEVKSCPAIYVAREDAYNLARQRLLGLLDFYGLDKERIIVVHDDVSLTDPASVGRLLATKLEYFPGEEPGFIFDTWDRCIGADPDKTSEVVPAVERVDDLIKAGAPFALTLSHSPWSSPDRTKGAVSYWAGQAARWKASKDEVTGHGMLDLVHMKNGQSGLHLEFEYLQHTFVIDGETSTCLIPQRIYDAPERVTPQAPLPKAKVLGKNQKLALDALRAAIVDGPDPTPAASDIPSNAKGVSIEKWRAVFDRYTPDIQSKHKGARFTEASTSLCADSVVRHVAGFAWVPPRPDYPNRGNGHVR